MVNSMTGFAAVKGGSDGLRWAWELRSVNARGLDIRMRLPEGVDGLEPYLRAEIAKRVARGNLTLGLRLQRDGAGAASRLEPGQLAAVLDALAVVTREAARRGLTLADASAADILALRGVMEPATGAEEDGGAVLAGLKPGIAELLESFDAMRADEGRALAGVLARQLAEIARLAAAARDLVGTRAAEMEESFRAALARVTAQADGADPQRVAQELAMLAVKADITEELDRLDAHVAAAGALLENDGPIGRKLDFLMQEFNREANTLCSKSGHEGLTRIGLDLKAVIDQMREQVQNVE